MDVPIGVWISSIIIIFLISYITFWVTKKAYSRKWDEQE
ncbi:hypothetical protein PAE9249_01165 [Paenibacillus sp. CECT 9249]|nr:hypothetical protein PAE9249_01165 [Paenibacillus sp. CECT 9249]